MPRKPEPCIIAYFDIIGWSAACLNPGDASRVRNVARALQSRVEMRGNDERQKRWNATRDSSDIVKARDARLNFQLSVFSDNVAISAGHSHAPELILRAAELCRLLLRSGFLARGGITTGLLLHQENIIFGPALVRAVELEQCASKPRLLVDPDAADLIEAGAVLPDRDGRRILNWCMYGTIPGLVPPRPSLESITEEISLLESAISRGLKDASLEKHKRKWRYMRHSFAEMRKRLDS